MTLGRDQTLASNSHSGAICEVGWGILKSSYKLATAERTRGRQHLSQARAELFRIWEAQ